MLLDLGFKKAFYGLKAQHQPTVVVIMETIVFGSRAKNILGSLGYSRWDKLDTMGLAGAIWDQNIIEHTF